MRERERAQVGEEQRERERKRERIPSRLRTASAEPVVELKLRNCEIMTWAETKSRLLNRLSHPGAPVFNFFKNTYMAHQPGFYQGWLPTKTLVAFLLFVVKYKNGIVMSNVLFQMTHALATIIWHFPGPNHRFIKQIPYAMAHRKVSSKPSGNRRFRTWVWIFLRGYA